MQIAISAPVMYSGATPPINALIGNSVNPDVLQEINAHYGSTFYGERYDPINNAFMMNHVLPLRQASMQIEHTVRSMLSSDQIVPLTQIAHFESIPTAMHFPILLYPPVLELFRQGRLDGFGYDLRDLPQEDVYGRLLSNGHIKDVAAHLDPKTECVTFKWHIKSSDPELSRTELRAIDLTRSYIDEILETTAWDPTLIGSIRG